MNVCWAGFGVRSRLPFRMFPFANSNELLHLDSDTAFWAARDNEMTGFMIYVMTERTSKNKCLGGECDIILSNIYLYAVNLVPNNALMNGKYMFFLK